MRDGEYTTQDKSNHRGTEPQRLRRKGVARPTGGAGRFRIRRAAKKTRAYENHALVFFWRSFPMIPSVRAFSVSGSVPWSLYGVFIVVVRGRCAARRGVLLPGSAETCRVHAETRWARADRARRRGR